jgi:hypothetical protein
MELSELVFWALTTADHLRGGEREAGRGGNG